MASYVISKMNILSIKSKINDFEKDDLKVPTGFFLTSAEIEHSSNSLTIEIEETVTLNFNYLKEPLNVPLSTKSLIDLNTGLMVSSPSGIGLISKGGTKKYVDTYIGKVMAKILCNDESAYSSLNLSSNLMNPNIWGTETRYLKFNLPEIGNCTLSGKNLNPKIDDLSHILGNKDKTKMLTFKVYSDVLKRTVTVSSDGIVKVNSKNISAMYEYINNIMTSNNNK